MSTEIPGTYKPSFNSGEIAAEAAGRTELKSYYSGALHMARAEPVPQGGFDLMPGTRQIARARGKLTTAATVTLTVAGGPHAPDAVVATGDAGAPVSFVMADLSALSASASCNCRLEYRLTPGDAWTLFPTILVDASARSWRGGLPPNAPVSARYFRLVRVGGSGSVTVSVGTSLVLRAEGDLATAAAPFAFSIDRATAYDLVFTEGNCDIYRERVFKAAVSVPYTEAQLAALRARQRDKTMLLFHEDVPTKKLLWQAEQDWLFGDQVFKNIPDVDLGGTYSKTANKWQITVIIAATTTAHVDQSLLELTVGGETTEAISMVNAWNLSTDRDAIAADIKAKIEALADIDTGVTVTAEAVAVAYNYPFTIEFTGGDNLGQDFTLSGRVTSPVSAACNSALKVRGDAGGEPLVSVARGYARDGEFWQQRTILAGFKSKSTAFLASVLGDYFNLNVKIIAADGAILANLDTQSSDKIERAVAARHLLLFAQEGEYFIADRAISKTAALNVVQSSRNGCAENVPVVLADDAVFYVNRNNSIVYSCQYSDVAQAYESTPVSLMATHLVRGIVDAAFQRPKAGTDAGRYLIVRDDGLLVVGSIVRNQEITGFVRWPTDGLVKRVMVNGKDEVRLIVSREIDGDDVLVFEAMDETLYLDQAREFTFEAPSTTVSGLDDLEGAQVWIVADGYDEGPFTVEDAEITIPTASSHVIVGRWTPPRVETLPPNREVAPNTVLRRKARIAAVECYVMETTSIAIGANGNAPRNIPLYRFGMPVDAPIPAQTRAVRASGLRGYVKEPTAVITQTRPGKLKVRDATIEQRL